MKYVKISITLPEIFLQTLDAVAKVKGRTRSQQIRETLTNDPDFYEVWSELANKIVEGEK